MQLNAGTDRKDRAHEELTGAERRLVASIKRLRQRREELWQEKNSMSRPDRRYRAATATETPAVITLRPDRISRIEHGRGTLQAVLKQPPRADTVHRFRRQSYPEGDGTHPVRVRFPQPPP